MSDDHDDEEKDLTPYAAIEQRIQNAMDTDHIARRFMTYVQRTDHMSCWIWIGGLHERGYGRFFMYGETYMAHRASYIIFKGPIQDAALFVLHQCDRKQCVNPRHLRLGTAQENMDEAVQRKRTRAHNRILSDDDVREIRRSFLGRDGEHHVLGERFGVSHSTIANIVNGYTYLRADLFPTESVQGDLFDTLRSVSTKRPKGEKHHKSKLTWELVRAMRAEGKAGAGPTALAKKYGLGKAQVSAILRNKFWRE